MSDLTQDQLHDNIIDEVQELAMAMLDGNPEKIIDECVDVINSCESLAEKAHEENERQLCLPLDTVWRVKGRMSDIYHHSTHPDKQSRLSL